MIAIDAENELVGESTNWEVESRYARLSVGLPVPC